MLQRIEKNFKDFLVPFHGHFRGTLEPFSRNFVGD